MKHQEAILNRLQNYKSIAQTESTDVSALSPLSGHMSALQDDLNHLGILHAPLDNSLITPAGYLGHEGGLRVLPYVLNNHKKGLASYSRPYEKFGKTCLEMNHNGKPCELQISPYEQEKSEGPFAHLIKFLKWELQDKDKSDISVIHGMREL